MGTVKTFAPMDLPGCADFNPERIKLWTDALRSGKYKQSRRLLSDGENGYCCLGVACEVAIDHGLDLARRETSAEGVLAKHYHPETGKCVVYGAGETGYLPVEVADWYGLDSRNPWVYYEGQSHTLIALNDDGAFTFNDIADIIDRNYTPQPVAELAGVAS